MFKFIAQIKDSLGFFSIVLFYSNKIFPSECLEQMDDKVTKFLVYHNFGGFILNPSYSEKKIHNFDLLISVSFQGGSLLGVYIPAVHHRVSRRTYTYLEHTDWTVL